MASKPKRSQSSILLEQRQLKEVEKLESQTAQRKLASARRTRGRASLISGSEEGIGGDPLFGQKNLATKERIGVERKALKAATDKAASIKERNYQLALNEDIDYARSQRRKGLL